jgi:hypothetical protein
MMKTEVNGGRRMVDGRGRGRARSINDAVSFADIARGAQ